ncbi:MAG: guanylate cyclase [Oscillatoriales cyanobacterium]|nr:MAG: guanylate cyclase [Oscillatoriales cyanobacterium]
MPLEPARPDQTLNPETDTPSVLALKQLVARLQREQNKTQDLLSSLGFALRSFNNLNQFLELIPLVASRVTDAAVSALVTFAPSGRLRLQRLHCTNDNACLLVRPSIEAAIKAVETHNIPLEQFDDLVRQQLGSIARVFSTSILIQNRDRGRLYIFSPDPEYVWTETRRKLVQLIADQTAVAMFNDELVTELRRKQRLDRELEIGAEIQLRLFPRHYPDIDGITLAARCTPASHVGGDYYDFIPTHYAVGQDEELEDDSETTHQTRSRWGIAIGDVMGKGVPAGLLMTLTRGMLRAEALNRRSPAQILQHLNRAMYADLENSHRFVTLFYSEYDPATRRLAYSNAAHNPPLFWRSRTDTIEKLDTWGMLVGLDSDTEYEEDFVILEPGDTILYYTDGFTEASNPEGDRFEEDTLIDAFQSICRQHATPQEILEELFEQLRTFVGFGRSNDDDVTLVVLQSTA